MEEPQVVIVGAGPSGLVLGLSLAKYEVSSLILEKDLEIGEDPRGVYLAGDAVRILCQLGIEDQLSFIGEDASVLNFHRSDFRNPPFFKIQTGSDWLEQTVPNGIFQIQPRLESVLRDTASKSQYCHLKPGCQVTSREELADGLIVTYEENGIHKQVKTSWLVGADGKTGVVRKKFLEPTANIQQVVGLSAYTATWIAANLKITLPTPDTHPDLCVWKMGMSSSEVYDLFWPENWHFCSPPGKPTACGRFGPTSSRLWRHEFAEPGWDDSKDSVELLWDHITPMITRSADKDGRPFEGGEISFPRDCVEILRCRPFTFAQKVANKWFHNRTILIGDAAHVFPPFGGQGVACGMGDGSSLAWRLALLLRSPKLSNCMRDDILNRWSAERRQAVDDSTRTTMVNGKLCNKSETWRFYLLRQVTNFISFIPGAPTFHSMAQAAERAGYKATKRGFFLAEHRGGGRIAQIYVKSSSGRVILSDKMLQHGQAAMTIFVINGDLEEAKIVVSLLNKVQMSPSILSEGSVVSFSSESARYNGNTDSQYRPCPRDELERLEIRLREGYSGQNYIKRFPRGTKYAIVRPDLIVFATCTSMNELEICLRWLKGSLGG